jgi:hypothetical protein
MLLNTTSLEVLGRGVNDADGETRTRWGTSLFGGKRDTCNYKNFLEHILFFTFAEVLAL